MEQLIIALILLIGPNHELLGGVVLPGASTDMLACEKKAAAYVQALNPASLPAGATPVPACAALAAGNST